MYKRRKGERIVIKKSETEIVKLFMQSQLDTYVNGVIYTMMENNTITWQIASAMIDFNIFHVDDRMEQDEIKMAISKAQEKTISFYDDNVGKNINVVVMPIVDENEPDYRAAFLTITPKVHPLQNAFSHVGPIITNLFPEGAFISLTDTNHILQVQRSEKYDIPVVEPGYDITQQQEIVDVIKSGNILRYDDDTLTYGPPVRVTIAPYLDVETKKPAGVINIIRPKQAELSLKDMSESLEKQLSEVSLTIQELAEASGVIHENEMEVNREIQEINDMAHQIFEVSNLIKSIADSTKMLGLNASIEAARAGNAGRGFGVVADEINKLSDQSKNTVPKIKKLTDDIKAKTEESKQKSQHSLSSSQEQVAATEEMTATIEAIQAVSIELSNIANSI
jgi:Methyl-accepting chemotaxis protein (MCP) signalling domain